MTRDEARQEIKRRISCKPYLQKAKHGGYICPFCGSGTGSHHTGAFKLYDTNTWTCWACNKSGDVIDLCMNQTGADHNTALSLLAQSIGIEIDPYRSGDRMTTEKNKSQAFGWEDVVNEPPAADKEKYPTPTPTESTQAHVEAAQGTQATQDDKTTSGQESQTQTADYTQYYLLCRDRLKESPEAIAYLQGRGISVDNAIAHWVGYDPAADPAGAPGAIGDVYRPHPCPRLIMPTTKAHYVARSIDPETPKAFEKLNPSKDKGAGAPGIFNRGALYAQDVQYVFVFESITDALSCIEVGREAIALNSAVNTDRLVKCLESKGTAATLILCPDNDPGEKTRERVIKRFRDLSESLDRLNIRNIMIEDIANGTGGKDANEALQKNRAAFTSNVEAAIQKAPAPPAADPARTEAAQEPGIGQKIERLLDSLKGADSFSEYKAAEAQAHELIRRAFIAGTGQDQQRATQGLLVYDNVVKEFQTADDETITIKSFPFFSKVAKIKKHSTIAIAADTGGGKSSLAINFLNDLSVGYPCIYFNLEMDNLTFLRRLVSIESGIELDRIEGYKNDTKTAEAVNTYIRLITMRQPIQLIQDVYLLNDIENIIAASTAQKERPTTMVFIDHSLLVELSGKSANRYERFTVISEQLRKMALRYNVVIFVLLQQNRAGKSEDEERPKNSSLKESGSWENDATHICFLWYDKAVKRKKLILTKNRGGDQCEIQLDYRKKTQTYKEAKEQAAANSTQQDGNGKKSKREKAKEKLLACYEAAAAATGGKPTLRDMAEAADVTTTTLKAWVKEYGGCTVNGKEIDPAGIDTEIEYTGFIKLTPAEEEDLPFGDSDGANLGGATKVPDRKPKKA